jgi:hypothetical protein
MEHAGSFASKAGLRHTELISGLVLAQVFTFNRNMPDVPSLAATDGRSLDDLLVAVG